MLPRERGLWLLGWPFVCALCFVLCTLRRASRDLRSWDLRCFAQKSQNTTDGSRWIVDVQPTKETALIESAREARRRIDRFAFVG
jgi:hypothetical protein